MFFLKNNKGMALLPATILGAVIISFSVFLMKQNTISEKRRLHVSQKENERNVEKYLNDYLSDQSNCKKLFSEATLDTNNVLNFTNVKLGEVKNQIIDGNGKIVFGNINLNINSISAAGVSRELVDGDYIYANSILNVETERKENNLKLNNFKKKIQVPITFEYLKNTEKTFIGCHSRYSDTFKKDGVEVGDSKLTEMRKKNCEMFGGEIKFNSCVFKTLKIDASDPTEEEFNLRDTLCSVDIATARSFKRTGGQPTPTTDLNLYSKFCPKVTYGGCTEGTGLIAPEGIINVYNGRMSSNTLNNYLKQTYEDLGKNKTRRLASQLLLSMNLAPDVFSKIIQGDNGYKFKSESNDIIKATVVAGALLGSASSLLLFNDDILTSFLGVIFNCSSKRKVNTIKQCKSGQFELVKFLTQKEKFKCKKWSCKCRWVNEKTIEGPTDSEVASAILNGATPMKIPLDENPENAEDLRREAELQIENLKNELATATTLSLLYAKLAEIEKDIDIPELNDPNDPNNDDPALNGEFTDEFTNLIKHAEITLWKETVTEPIKNYDYKNIPADQVVTYIQNITSVIETEKTKLEVATTAETSNLATAEKNNLILNFRAAQLSLINNSTTLGELAYHDPGAYISRFNALGPNNSIVAAYISKKSALEAAAP